MPAMGHGSGQRGGAPPPLNSGAAAQPPVIPRKVLINPNFKGGVEAATSEYLNVYSCVFVFNFKMSGIHK